MVTRAERIAQLRMELREIRIRPKLRRPEIKARVTEARLRAQLRAKKAIASELGKLKIQAKAGLLKALSTGANPRTPEQIVGFLRAIRKNPRMTPETKTRAARNFLARIRPGGRPPPLTRREIRERLGPFAGRRRST